MIDFIRYVLEGSAAVLAFVLVFIFLSKISHYFRKSNKDWDSWDTVIIVLFLFASVVIFGNKESSFTQDDFEDYQLGGGNILSD